MGQPKSNQIIEDVKEHWPPNQGPDTRDKRKRDDPQREHVEKELLDTELLLSNAMENTPGLDLIVAQARAQPPRPRAQSRLSDIIGIFFVHPGGGRLFLKYFCF